MSDDSYDDGLVHGHAWDDGGRNEDRFSGGFPQADVGALRTPSTALHDDHIFCD